MSLLVNAMTYCRQINQIELKKNVSKAASIGFTASLISGALSGNLCIQSSLQVATFWATATFLNGVVTPLFKNRPDTRGLVSAKGAVSVFGAAFLAKVVSYDYGRGALQSYIVFLVTLDYLNIRDDRLNRAV
jgi:hypothetical protein